MKANYSTLHNILYYANIVLYKYPFTVSAYIYIYLHLNEYKMIQTFFGVSDLPLHQLFPGLDYAYLPIS